MRLALLALLALGAEAAASSRLRSNTAGNIAPDSVARVAELLERTARSSGSLALLSLAQKAADPDQFEHVKGLIKGMITQHYEAMNDETDHKAFCDQETRNSKTKTKKLTNAQHKGKADLDKQTAELAELKDDISTLHDSIASAHKANTEALTLRQSDQAKFDEVKASYEQQHVAGTSDENFRQSASDNAGKELEFERSKNSNEIAIKKMENDVKNKSAMVLRLKKALVESKQDLATTEEELHLSVDYEGQISHQCVAKVDPYKERKARREEQISSLHEAYGILSGESIP